MIRIEKGTIGLLRDGTIVVFPDGNRGKDNEYLRYVGSPEGKKELIWLFASPKILLEHIQDDRDRIEELEEKVSQCPG